MTLLDILDIYGIDCSTLSFKPNSEDLTEEEIRKSMENEIIIVDESRARRVYTHEIGDIDVFFDEPTQLYVEE